MASQKYYNEITVMKAMATLFITWFHFKSTVPEYLSPLFIGGAIGNSLFFFCSGYLLKFKEEKYSGQWFVDKYFRIMPTVWVMFTLIMMCDCIRGIHTIGLNWWNWLFPLTHYWFICSILIYFLLIYIYKNFLANRNNVVSYTGILTLSILAIVFQEYSFLNECNHTDVIIDCGGINSSYYMLFVLWGFYERRRQIPKRERKQGFWTSVLFIILTFALFYGYKKYSYNISMLIELQVVFIPLLLALIVIAFRQFSIYIVNNKISERIKRIVIFLSNITLEIYVVQMYIINWIMPEIYFPINILLSLVCIITTAYIVKAITENISKTLRKI